MADIRTIPAAPTFAGVAAALLAVTQGVRSSFGLFISPIHTATGLGPAAISFALDTSQLASGLAQPLAGRLAERIGNARLVVAGAVTTAAGMAILPWLGSTFALTAGPVLVAVAGTALASAPVLIAAVIARGPATMRGRASGLVGREARRVSWCSARRRKPGSPAPAARARCSRSLP